MNARILIGVLIAGVTTAVTAAMLVLGSPAKARERRFDDLRVEHLSELAQAINAHHAQLGRLPSTVSQLGDEWSQALELRDPETARPYEYQALDQAAYELCAVFHYSSDAGARWPHGAGRHCFKRRVTRAGEPSLLRRW